MGNAWQLVQYGFMIAFLVLVPVFVGMWLLGYFRDVRFLDTVVWRWLGGAFPGLFRRAALKKLERLVAGGIPDLAQDFAKRFRLERECVAAAERILGFAAAGRYAARFGLAADRDRLFTAAFNDACARGAEAQAISLAEEGGVPLLAARVFEKGGTPSNLCNAGILFEKAGLLGDAARCFEAGGEPFRAFQAMIRAGMRREVEALAARTQDFVTKQAAATWLNSAGG